MRHALLNLEIHVLEKMYEQEIETLKRKLLSGSVKKDIKRQRDKAIELANTIHKKQFGTVTVLLKK